MDDKVMEVINYTLLNKQENKKGVTLTFKKDSELAVEVWEAHDPGTLWEKIKAFFGVKIGRWGWTTEDTTSEFTVFYPISEHGTHHTTDMCYKNNGVAVDFRLSQTLLRLVEMASFEEIPAKNHVVI